MLTPAYDSDSGWGYIDRKGDFVISPQFRYCYPFDESLGLAVVLRGEKSEFINKKGLTILESPASDITIVLDFEGVHIFDKINGLAPAKLGEKWGFIEPGAARTMPRRSRIGPRDTCISAAFGRLL